MENGELRMENGDTVDKLFVTSNFARIKKI